MFKKKKKVSFSSRIEDLDQTGMQHPDDFFTHQMTKNDLQADLAKELDAASATPPVISSSLHEVTPSGGRPFGHQGMHAPAPVRDREREAGEEWLPGSQNYDGQLAVDVYQTDGAIVVQAAVAGVRSDDLDVELGNDMITIKGVRRLKSPVPDEDYLFRECYFGGFSRSIILPVDIQHDKVRATLENGLLTVLLPKSNRPRHGKIPVEEIEE